jgi:hypothetical protein
MAVCALVVASEATNRAAMETMCLLVMLRLGGFIRKIQSGYYPFTGYDYVAIA